MDTKPLRHPGAIAIGLAALAAIAYLPFANLPFIADDYVVIALARRFGPAANWAELAQDPLFRFRAVFSVTTFWLERAFGLWPQAFAFTSIALHVVCVWLVAALGIWKTVGWRISVPAAAFFAIAEGHQEAVIWYSAMPELQVFAFAVGSLLLWIVWLQNRRPLAYACSLLCFLIALLCKESAVVVAGLQAVVLAADRRRSARDWLSVVPTLAISAVYFALIYSTRAEHRHFNDGTFSLAAPFWLVAANSTARLLWIWGFAAAALLLVSKRRAGLGTLALSIGWIVVGLLPYSFLTYMTRVPSRHTYLASAGLALLVGAAFAVLMQRSRRNIVAVVAAVVLFHNLSYMWVRKQPQYAMRAAPTAELVRTARSTEAPITVECFPYALDVAVEAVRLEAQAYPHRLNFQLEPGCTGFRYTVQPAANSETTTSRRSRSME